jgi:hypothetical protein
MVFVCDFCNKQIAETCTLYFGFDCLCCSNHCRSQVISINLQIDPAMNNPHKWFIHKIRMKRTNQDMLIRKNKSLSDLVSQLKV